MSRLQNYYKIHMKNGTEIDAEVCEVQEQSSKDDVEEKFTRNFRVQSKMRDEILAPKSYFFCTKSLIFTRSKEGARHRV